MSIRVALVEDQVMVRSGLRMIVESQPDMDVVFEASDGASLPTRLRADPADVVLMDVQMPHVDGIAATEAVLALSDPPRVIVLTTFESDEYLVRAIRAGASGFLLKDGDPEHLLSSIRTVHEGEAVLSSRMTARLLRHVTSMPPGPDEGLRSEESLTASLTPREVEVLQEMARGSTNTEIAADLFLSEATVKSHVSRVLAKTGSRDRVHAVIRAFRAGLVDPSEMHDPEGSERERASPRGERADSQHHRPRDGEDQQRRRG